VQESPNVHGRELTQKLSNIIDQAILAVLQEMELPDDATIVLE
jgi:hypothetical protein